MASIMVVTEDDEQTAAECRGCTERMYGPDVVREARRHVARTGHVVDLTRHEVIRHANQEVIDRLRAKSLVVSSRPAATTREDHEMAAIIASRQRTDGAGRKAAWRRRQAGPGQPHRGATRWRRATCAACLRDLSVRKDGMFRMHKDEEGQPCPGSGTRAPC